MAPLNVAVFVYPEADIIDFSGPLEIYSTNPPTGVPRAFQTTTFAAQSPVKLSASAMTLVPDVSLDEVDAELDKFDILVVPGAHPDMLNTYIPSEEGKRITSLLKSFAQLKPRQETGHRIIQSVCTGALILAASGILKGKKATTHHMSYDRMKELADEAAGGDSGIEVLRKRRWVDSGLNDSGVRIVNAGGVTSGFDASLNIVKLVAGKEVADWVQEIVEYEKRDEHNGWAN
ncbi:ThiJ/PfpI family protein-like protein [Lophiostoma macrostomum CBS 122681]|uniref:ThiJ/PfpI family protein-like protein n=1 Tax=Lophiostoma macrostomum CBS 122681 TaxID=1314788 RepID=A0A6A6SQK2_9PLEO|nr:ThiJ/PfpI family protein-like protein [Lophiostoma macrostomum CBS 122681]